MRIIFRSHRVLNLRSAGESKTAPKSKVRYLAGEEPAESSMADQHLTLEELTHKDTQELNYPREPVRRKLSSSYVEITNIGQD